MTKRYATNALIYAVIAMVLGVFYREFTKFSGFTDKTNLSVMHTHYFLLGMVFFLLLMLVEKIFAFSSWPRTKAVLIIYHVGLNIAGAGFLIRGLTQVWRTELSKGMNSAISGFAGIGHILLSAAIILFLVRIRKIANQTTGIPCEK